MLVFRPHVIDRPGLRGQASRRGHYGPSKGAGLNLELKTHLNGHCNLFVQLLNAKSVSSPVVRGNRERLEGLGHQLLFVLAGFVAIRIDCESVIEFEARWVPISRLCSVYHAHTEAECATVAHCFIPSPTSCRALAHAIPLSNHFPGLPR